MAVGEQGLGANFASGASPQYRAKLVSNIVSYVSRYHFDGVDIDWEEEVPQNQADYVALIKDVRAALDSAFPRRHMFLSTDVNTGQIPPDIAVQVAPYVDSLNLETFQDNGMSSVAAYSRAGIPVSKMLLGIGVANGYYDINEARVAAKVTYVESHGLAGHSPVAARQPQAVPDGPAPHASAPDGGQFRLTRACMETSEAVRTRRPGGGADESGPPVDIPVDRHRLAGRGSLVCQGWPARGSRDQCGWPGGPASPGPYPRGQAPLVPGLAFCIRDRGRRHLTVRHHPRGPAGGRLTGPGHRGRDCPDVRCPPGAPRVRAAPERFRPPAEPPRRPTPARANPRVRRQRCSSPGSSLTGGTGEAGTAATCPESAIVGCLRAALGRGTSRFRQPIRI